MFAAVEEMNIEAILAVMNTIELVVEIRPKKKKKKDSGLYGIWTHDPALYQLS